MRNLRQFSPARTNLAADLATGREQGYDFAAADPEFQAQAAKSCPGAISNA